MSDADWVACPHCGEKIKRSAKACKYCGSDERTGWSDDTYMDGIDTPEEGDYEDGLESEGFEKPPADAWRLAVAGVALTLVLIFLAWLMRAAM